ncbi:MAG: hypothetical protein KKA73_13195, partial [Chloroflexi bacterium]|nr:hypothetical protein [Chloroflexota bacterium]
GLRLFVLGEATYTILNARVGLRHRGFPDWYPLLEQGDGDDGTGSDVADATANDGHKWRDDGAGVLWRRWDLSTAPGGSARFFGRFRVYARWALTSTADVWAAHLVVYNAAITGSEESGYSQAATAPVDLTDATLTGWFVADMGEINLPQINYPEGLGDTIAQFLSVVASQTTGSGRLDLDYLLLIPVADEGHLVTTDSAAPIDNTEGLLSDTISQPPLVAKTDANLQILAYPAWAGQLLQPAPIAPSRLVATGSKEADTVGWLDYIATTVYLSGHLLPRYRIPPEV